MKRSLIRTFFGVGALALALGITASDAHAKTFYKNTVTLKWKPIARAKGYEVEILKDGKKVLDKTAKGSSFQTDLDPGQYQYRVRSIDSLGRKGSWSKESALLVEPGAPIPIKTDEPVFAARPEGRNVTLKWEETGDPKYRLRVWKGDQQILDQEVTGPEALVKIKEPGTYRYELASVRDGITGAFGPSQEFKVAAADPPKVHFITPRRQHVNYDRKVKFQWKASGQPSRYKLKILRKDETGQAVQFSEEWLQTQSVTRELPNGRYLAMVTAADDLGEGPVKLQEFEVRSDGSEYYGKFYWFPGVGLTSINYKETASPDYTGLAVTPKIGAQLRMAKNWDLGLAGYMSLFPVSSNSPQTTLQFLGLNARVGRVVLDSPSGWSVSLMAGLYFTTTFTSDNSIGFKNMMGPQLFPVLRKRFLKGSSVASYLKFSPISNNPGSSLVPTLANKEIAAGLSYNLLTSGGRTISFSLDAAKLDLNFQDQILIESRSLTFGIGTMF